jgi:hypothetical protein
MTDQQFLYDFLGNLHSRRRLCTRAWKDRCYLIQDTGAFQSVWIRWISVHQWWDFSFDAETEKARFISEASLYLMRRRPTLPYTFAHSTIGPAGLNFRVRDGNGWNPRGKITANLAISR